MNIKTIVVVDETNLRAVSPPRWLAPDQRKEWEAVCLDHPTTDYAGCIAILRARRAKRLTEVPQY